MTEPRGGSIVERAKVSLGDLLGTVALVWTAGPILLVVVLLLTVALALVPAATLWVSKLLVDAVGVAIAGGARDADAAYGQLVRLLVLQLFILLLGLVLRAGQDSVRELLADALRHHANRCILEKAASLDVAHFENAGTYDALCHATAEVGTRPISIIVSLVSLGQALIVLGSIGTLMTRLDARIMPLVLLASVPGVLVSMRFGAESYLMLRRRGTLGRAQQYLSTLLTSDDDVKEVRFFGAERYLLERWHAYYKDFRLQLVRLLTQRGWWTVAAAVTSTAFTGAASLPVLRRAADGQLTIGDVSLFIAGIGQVQAQFSLLLSSVATLYTDVLHMRNLFEFLELPSRDLTAGETWTGPIASIEFDQVAFCYPFTDREILRDVSFRIGKGQSLALVGRNGAGKTTIVKLLTRLFEPTGGRILLNGQDASRFSPASVQRAMSIIFQDYGHYHMTARENIALGHPAAMSDDDAIEGAGMKSRAHEFVDRLPERYDTMLGRMFPGGVQLSGGQWQRIALGRMYFRPASVTIYDEPTAALDAVAEADAVRQLQDEAGDRISVIISHRFSTIRLADAIVVLNDGTIVESGSHEQLIQQGGEYAKLFALQAAGYREDGERIADAVAEPMLASQTP
jgi:ATP-binding cassette subfamily B protein